MGEASRVVQGGAGDGGDCAKLWSLSIRTVSFDWWAVLYRLLIRKGREPVRSSAISEVGPFLRVIRRVRRRRRCLLMVRDDVHLEILMVLFCV
jgi:hypothetical protein